MVQVQTILRVADNSGGKLVRCLKILRKGTKAKYAKIGDIIIISIKELRAKNRYLSKVRKGEIYKALIIRTCSPLKRSFGLSLHFSANCVVLLNKQMQPIATRIIGFIPYELKKKKFSKIVTISAGTV